MCRRLIPCLAAEHAAQRLPSCEELVESDPWHAADVATCVAAAAASGDCDTILACIPRG